MAFEELKEHTENIKNHSQEYIESNLEYYKLKGFKLAMKSMTMIVKFILLFLCFLMVLLFFSIAGALAIGEWLGNTALGFLVVAGVYLIITSILFLFKNKIVEKPILEKFSEIFFND